MCLSVSHLGSYDVAVIGAGIIGMATARELKKRAPDMTVTVIDKEWKLAAHQTGINSGIIYAGVYTRPGSASAKLCHKGMSLIYKYCNEKCIPYSKVGKLVVARDKREEILLEKLYKDAVYNNVPSLRLLGPEEICKLEPYCKGCRALHSPHTGIVDWAQVTRQLGLDFKQLGGDLNLCFNVAKFDLGPEFSMDTPEINRHPVTIISTDGRVIKAGFVLTCAGLFSDRVAALFGGKKDPVIVPFKGNYLTLCPEKRCLIRGNIFPVPDPDNPHHGVHISPRMDGTVWIGPSPGLALSREACKRPSFKLREIWGSLKNRGVQKLLLKRPFENLTHWTKSLFVYPEVERLQKYIPAIDTKDISRGPAGICAHTVTPTGEVQDEFILEEGCGPSRNFVVHCRAVPSPAATSSLAIAQVLARHVLNKMCNATQP